MTRAQVAQLVEHVTENHGVGGSIPPLGTTSSRSDGESVADKAQVPGSICNLSTPGLLVERIRLERNATRMRDKVRQLGVTLRPHVKTSKSIDVLNVLAGGSDVPITVSTLAEARYFFAHGVTDILYAVGIAPVKLPEVADLIRAGCNLRIILDTIEAADSVRAFVDSEKLPIEVLIEIDSDG